MKKRLKSPLTHTFVIHVGLNFESLWSSEGLKMSYLSDGNLWKFHKWTEHVMSVNRYSSCRKQYFCVLLVILVVFAAFHHFQQLWAVRCDTTGGQCLLNNFILVLYFLKTLTKLCYIRINMNIIVFICLVKNNYIQFYFNSQSFFLFYLFYFFTLKFSPD